MPSISVESGGRFGTAFHKALLDKGMSLVEFARKLDANYEFQRKILRGDALPGKRMLEAMCKVLGLKLKDAEVLVAQDRMEKKVGKIAFGAATGRLERSGEFDALVPHLTKQQIDMILAQMKAMVQQNKKAS
jgi:transcriptional regulator with XRE-family HTH domain